MHALLAASFARRVAVMAALALGLLIGCRAPARPAASRLAADHLLVDVVVRATVVVPPDTATMVTLQDIDGRLTSVAGTRVGPARYQLVVVGRAAGGRRLGVIDADSAMWAQLAPGDTLQAWLTVTGDDAHLERLVAHRRQITHRAP